MTRAMNPNRRQMLRTFANGFALMTKKQWLGNRTKLGFYHYGRRMRPNRKASDLWWSRVPVEIAAPMHALSKADTQAWIRYRLVTLMILEAARCLDEGVARDADDLDCAMCLTGWATHRGGPIGYARELGFDAIAAACVELSKKLGARFAPLYANAVYAENTPGLAGPLGFELDFEAFYSPLKKKGFDASIQYGLFIPMAGFRNLSLATGFDPSLAHRILGPQSFRSCSCRYSANASARRSASALTMMAL